MLRRQDIRKEEDAGSMQFSTLKLSFVGSLVALLGLGCQTSEGGETLFTRLPASATGIDFENRLVDTKEVNVFTYRNYYNGGGASRGEPSGHLLVTERTA